MAPLWQLSFWKNNVITSGFRNGTSQKIASVQLQVGEFGVPSPLKHWQARHVSTSLNVFVKGWISWAEMVFLDNMMCVGSGASYQVFGSVCSGKRLTCFVGYCVGFGHRLLITEVDRRTPLKTKAKWNYHQSMFHLLHFIVVVHVYFKFLVSLLVFTPISFLPLLVHVCC